MGKVGFRGDVPCPTYNIRGKLGGQIYVKYTWVCPRIIYVYYAHNRVSKTTLGRGKYASVPRIIHVGRGTVPTYNIRILYVGVPNG